MSIVRQRPWRRVTRRSPRRWLAGVAGALFLLSVGLGFEDPGCPHHREPAGGHAGLHAAPESAAGHGSAHAGAHAAGHAGDPAHDGAGQHCTCPGACHGSGPALALAVAPDSTPASVAALLPAARRPRAEPLPPPADHLLPYATAPPAPLPT